MHAFILVGEDPKTEVEKITKNIGSKVIEQELLKIADVKEFRKYAHLSLTNKTTILSRNIDLASPETQNALLKLLEEPQKNLSFILTAGDTQNILPTIISRCELIELSPQTKASQKQISEAKKFFEGSVGEKFAVTSQITSRDDAREFLKSLIIGGHALMVKSPKLAPHVEAAQNALNAINKNTNVQLQLTAMVISLN